MDDQPTTSNKKKLLVPAVLLVVVLVFVALIVFQKRNVPSQPISPSIQEPKLLSNVDEVTLQKQLHDILAKGKEADCATLNDERYQFACKDFFKIGNKK